MAAGLIIAGGASSRFGGQKALARLGGASLLERAAITLRNSCKIVAASVRPGPVSEAAVALGLPPLPDPPGLPEGPLAGLLAGLRWAETAGCSVLITLPCDTPLAPADVGGRLIDALGDGLCAAVRTPDGVEALCAAWRTTIADQLEAELRAGRHPAVKALLGRLAYRPVDYADTAAFLNVNTPEEFAAAEARLT